MAKKYEDIPDYCPNCDYKLTITFDTIYEGIVEDNGHLVTSCPNCLQPLDVDNGKIIIIDKGRIDYDHS